MDQGPLVGEQVNAGAKLAAEFAKRFPLQAAFWLKDSEDRDRQLYLVSDQINDTNFDVAYGEVYRLIGGGPQVWLELSQVRVKGVEDPIAKAVIEEQQKYPNPYGTRLRTRMLGGRYIEEAYIYPIPVPVPS